MNESLRQLYALHLIDERLNRIRQGLAALDAPPPIALQLQRIEAELGKQEAALRKARADLQDVELQLRTLEEKREADRRKLYGGKVVATRELQALEHEIETLGTAIGAHEERVLEAMERVEPLQAAVDKLREYQKTARERLAALRQTQEEERRRLTADLAQAEPLREPAAREVDPALLRLYDHIRRDKGHPGLAVIQGGSCGNCHTAVPSLVMRKLREEDTILRCDHCTRIYYLPSGESGPA